jgi:excinuclease ABC subunit A
MHFLPDVYVTCDACHGKRYNRETLDIEFKGKSIADVLDMTVEEAADFFRRAGRARQAGNAEARRAGLHQGRPAGDDAVGR